MDGLGIGREGKGFKVGFACGDMLRAAIVVGFFYFKVQYLVPALQGNKHSTPDLFHEFRRGSDSRSSLLAITR
jgi:hypothetical protein